MSSYDHWKTTDPADRELGRSRGTPVKYRCLDCPWRGKGSIARAQQFQATGHTVLSADDPRFTSERRKASA